MSLAMSSPSVLPSSAAHGALVEAVRGALGGPARGRRVVLRWVPEGEAIDPKGIGLALARLGVELTVACPEAVALAAPDAQDVDDAMVCWGGRWASVATPAIDADAEVVVTGTWGADVGPSTGWSLPAR